MIGGQQPAYFVMLLIISLWAGIEALSLEPGRYAGELVAVTNPDDPGERHAITFTVGDDGRLARFETATPTVEHEVEPGEERGWSITRRTRRSPDDDFGPDQNRSTGVAPQRMQYDHEDAGAFTRLIDARDEGRSIYVRPNLIVVDLTPDARRGDEPLLTTITFWPREHAAEGE